MNQDDMENGSSISCRGRGGRRVECAVARNSKEQGTGGSGPTVLERDGACRVEGRWNGERDC